MDQRFDRNNGSWAAERLKTKRCQSLLSKLKKTETALNGQKTWANVIALMHDKKAPETQKDAILRSIFSAYSKDKSQLWHTVLLCIFWPRLHGIRSRRWQWDTDPEELWQNVVWIFLQVISQLDIKKRKTDITRKIINDTAHKLHDTYSPRWSVSNRLVSLDTGNTSPIIAADAGIDYAGIDRHLAQESAISQLKTHRDAGIIDEETFLLLVGTRVYGQSVADYAREAGINQAFAHKRRQRAEKALRLLQ